MANNIWAGVNFGNSITNPGSVAQTYDTKTGKTTYGENAATKAVAASSAVNSAKGINAAAVATPKDTPAGAPVYQGGALGYAASSPQTNFAENPQAPGYGLVSPYAANPNAFPAIKNTAPIEPAKVESPSAILDAPDLTPAQKTPEQVQAEKIQAVQADPLYIGETNWKKLQEQYTPYQLEKATIRTKDGIFWNPEVNISNVTSKDPGSTINDFFKDIADAVASGKAKTDITAAKGAEDVTDADATPTDLKADSKDMNTAIGIFNSIMNTPGMDDLKEEVQDAKTKLDEYDQQMEELADDIRSEVEGEAPESYINALAAVRGSKIMRLRRQAERDYNNAVANFNSEKELKTQQINMLVNDSNNRYNRAFQTLQFEETKAQNAKSWETVKLNAKLSLPEGTKYTFRDGSVVEGIKENDNLATGTYTDANRNVYYYAIDKKTGKEAFPQVFIGKAPASGGGSISPTQMFSDYKATEAMNQMEEINAGLADGTLAKGFDQNGDVYYYDKKGYEAADADYAKRKSDWVPFNEVDAPSPYDYQKY